MTRLRLAVVGFLRGMFDTAVFAAAFIGVILLVYWVFG